MAGGEWLAAAQDAPIGHAEEQKLNKRPILYGPVSDGLFKTPQTISAKDEVEWAKRRMDSVRVAQYSDSKCGLPNTFDPTGAYLCMGRKDGRSSPCNKREGAYCLIRIEPLNRGQNQSCMYWEIYNAGDPEGRYCPHGKLDDARLSFGSTPKTEGFGCMRCEYGQDMMPARDSEGRTRWCALKGHPVESNSCCGDNEPID